MKYLLIASMFFALGYQAQREIIASLKRKLDAQEFKLQRLDLELDHAEYVSKVTGASLYQVLTGGIK